MPENLRLEFLKFRKDTKDGWFAYDKILARNKEWESMDVVSNWADV